MGQEDAVAAVFEYILTAYNLKQGFKIYEEHREKATENGLDQMHRMYALITLDEKISQRQKRRRPSPH